MERLIGVLGVAVFIAIAWLISFDRRRVPWRLVLAGVIVQVVIAALALTFPPIVAAVNVLAVFVTGVIDSARAGIEFIFGKALSDESGPWGWVFAIRALPVIIYFAALSAVLYHFGIMQKIIAGLAWVLRRTMGVTGAEALVTAANVFIGQTEAPFVVKPLLARMTRAQLMLLMVGGFATMAGSVLAAYVGLLGGADESAREMVTRNLLLASVMSAPAAIVMARIVMPETERPPDERHVELGESERATNVFEAATIGATDGLKLALNVAAMLIAFVAIVALLNWPLAWFSGLEGVAAWREARGLPVFSVEWALGAVLAPLAWVMGVGWSDAGEVGSLMGQKVMLTEFIAYSSLTEMIHDTEGARISARSSAISMFALCGFANVASIGIQIGGISALAPSRRGELARLAPRAMVAGALASWTTAAIAGMFLR
ncbi:MAG: nucleoside transporter C-terminal domain-containing protein [Phycisphaerales bacterium]